MESMSDLIPDSDKVDLASNFFDIHNTFSRPIIIYKTANQTIITTNPNYNFVYQNDGGNTVDYVPVSGVFNARIKYDDRQVIDYFTKRDVGVEAAGAQGEVRLAQEKGFVRIKVAADAYEFMKDCDRVTFDDCSFEIILGRRPHGLFGVDFYDFYLMRSQ